MLLFDCVTVPTHTHTHKQLFVCFCCLANRASEEKVSSHAFLNILLSEVQYMNMVVHLQQSCSNKSLPSSSACLLDALYHTKLTAVNLKLFTEWIVSQ